MKTISTEAPEQYAALAQPRRVRTVKPRAVVQTMAQFMAGIEPFVQPFYRRRVRTP